MPQYEPVKYIVENVECTVGGDGEDLWITTLRGKKPILAEKIKPTWDIGDELPFKPKLIKAEPNWYYERPAESEKPKTKTYPKQEKTYKADPAKIDSMEYSNARNLAVQLYCHTVQEGVPFDGEQLDKLFRYVSALGKDLVTVAKEQYGAVEQ